MKRSLLIVILFLLLSINSFSQNYDDKQNMKVEVTQDAFYPEGEMALYQFMFKNINYSDEAKANKVDGNVMTSFNVETDSTVSNVVILSGQGFGIDEEIKRILKEMKFSPAIQNGVKTKMNLMFNFPVRAH